MKQKIVPTSPKSPQQQERLEKREHKKECTQKTPFFGFSLIVIILLSFFTSVVGGFFLFQVPSDWPIVGSLSLQTTLDSPIRETVFFSDSDEKKAVTEQSPDILEQTVLLYDSAPSLEKNATILGNGSILTSDGWCVAPSSIFFEKKKGKEKKESAISPVVLLFDGREATIEMMLSDDVTGLTFFKLEEENVSPVILHDAYEQSIGEWVSVIEQELGNYRLFERRISGISSKNGIQSTQLITQRYRLDTFGEKHLKGAPVYTQKGQLIGVLDQKGEMIHSSVIRGKLESLLEDSRSVTHVSDAITYRDLGTITQKEREEKSLPDSGILILSVDGSKESLLQPNDVIIAINNIFVTETTDLSTIVHSQKPGTSFLFSILRDGESMNIDYVTSELAK